MPQFGGEIGEASIDRGVSNVGLAERLEWIIDPDIRVDSKTSLFVVLVSGSIHDSRSPARMISTVFL